MHRARARAYPQLAEEPGESGLAREARILASRLFELSELLTDVLAVEDVGAFYPHRVTYHASCHGLRVLNLGDRPIRLLRAVRGIDVIELPEGAECCGFVGTFAIKNADVSMAMSDKVRHVRGPREPRRA